MECPDHPAGRFLDQEVHLNHDLPKPREGLLNITDMECDWKRNEAIELAKQYLSSDKGKASAKERVDAMDAIRRNLKPPSFNFTESDCFSF